VLQIGRRCCKFSTLIVPVLSNLLLTKFVTRISFVTVFLIIKWRIRYNGILNARGWDGTLGNIGPETIHTESGLGGLGLKINL
jgi:hypothetical protein